MPLCPYCESAMLTDLDIPHYCPQCDHYANDDGCECAGCDPFGGDETQAMRDVDGAWQDNLGESPDC